MAKPINLTKLLAEYFYAVTLYDYRKNEVLIPDELLERYATDNGSFDIDRFIEDAKTGAFKKDYYDLLLPADLLTADSGTLKEIAAVHADIQKKSMKGGYIRAVLEVLHDKRFREEFNKKTEGFLDKAPGKEDFIQLFLKTAANQDSWNYSAVTPKKAAQEGNKDKVNNPYTAYKLFGQGEYSKLLIGYRAAPSLPLDKLRAKGFDAILTDENVCTIKNDDGSRSPIIPYEGVTKKLKLDHERYLEGVTKEFKFNTDLYRVNKDYYTVWKQRFLVLDMQMDEITKALQAFNDYVPYELNEELESKLNKLCEDIYNKYINARFYLDRYDTYADGKRYSDDDCKTVNDTFKKYYPYFDSSDENSKKTSVKPKSIADKIRWLLDKKESPLIKDSLNKDLEGKVWTRILHTFQTENALSGNRQVNDGNGSTTELFDLVEDKRETKYEEGSLSEPALCLFNLIDKNFHEAPSFCSGVYKFISKFDSNTSVPILRGTKAGEENKFIKALKSSMHALLPSNKAKKDFDAYLNEKENTCPDKNIPWEELAEKFLPKPKDNDHEGSISKLKMLYAIAMLDKEHSWEGSFNQYKSKLDASSDIEQAKKIFKEKMDSINKRFRQRMGF